MMMRQTMGALFVIISILMALYLYIIPGSREGFVDKIRCGVDLPSCPEGLRCMNGYCKSDIPPTLPPLSDLPIRPDRY